jgi:hypothetical protein
MPTSIVCRTVGTLFVCCGLAGLSNCQGRSIKSGEPSRPADSTAAKPAQAAEKPFSKAIELAPLQTPAVIWSDDLSATGKAWARFASHALAATYAAGIPNVPGAQSPLAWFKQKTGLDLGDPNQLQQTGIALEAGAVFFVEPLASWPVLGLRLRDPAAFANFLRRTASTAGQLTEATDIPNAGATLHRLQAASGPGAMHWACVGDAALLSWGADPNAIQNTLRRLSAPTPQADAWGQDAANGPAIHALLAGTEPAAAALYGRLHTEAYRPAVLAQVKAQSKPFPAFETPWPVLWGRLNVDANGLLGDLVSQAKHPTASGSTADLLSLADRLRPDSVAIGLLKMGSKAAAASSALQDLAVGFRYGGVDRRKPMGTWGVRLFSHTAHPSDALRDLGTWLQPYLPRQTAFHRKISGTATTGLEMRAPAARGGPEVFTAIGFTHWLLGADQNESLPDLIKQTKSTPKPQLSQSLRRSPAFEALNLPVNDVKSLVMVRLTKLLTAAAPQLKPQAPATSPPGDASQFSDIAGSSFTAGSYDHLRLALPLTAPP